MKCWNLSFSSTMSKISKINFLCRTLSKLWCRDPLRPLPSFLQHSWDHLYFFCKIQMKRQPVDFISDDETTTTCWVEARDQVKNMGQLGQLDSCHGEKVLPNQEVEATFQMEYLFYQQKKCYVMFLRFQWIIMACSVPLQLDNRPDDEQHPTSRCVACA